MIHDAMLQYQLPEILRTPLQELCLHIKSLQLGTIGSFLAKALQPPDALAVQNAIELLKTIGALDDMEELTPLGIYHCIQVSVLDISFTMLTVIRRILCNRLPSLYSTIGPKYWEDASYGVYLSMPQSSLNNCSCSCSS